MGWVTMPGAMVTPILSIVVLNWDQLERTERCIASLRANTDVPYELILVDNGSASSTAARLEALADTAVLHGENQGFARGMNAGLRVATGRLVAFVNNDTVFPPRWATPLVETFDRLPRPGIVLPAVSAAGNQTGVREQPGNDQIEFTPFTAIPSGVVYLVDRADASELGGFSELFPVASAEDIDLLFTYWANDRSVVLDERVLVEHESSVTVAAKLPDRDERYRTNRLLFTARWAKADPDDIPRLESCPPETFAANLEKARIAGTWMDHWFRTIDRALAAEARIAKLKTSQDESRRKLPPASTSRIGKIRSRLGRFARGS